MVNMLTAKSEYEIQREAKFEEKCSGAERVGIG